MHLKALTVSLIRNAIYLSDWPFFLITLPMCFFSLDESPCVFDTSLKHLVECIACLGWKMQRASKVPCVHVFTCIVYVSVLYSVQIWLHCPFWRQRKELINHAVLYLLWDRLFDPFVLSGRVCFVLCFVFVCLLFHVVLVEWSCPFWWAVCEGEGNCT